MPLAGDIEPASYRVISGLQSLHTGKRLKGTDRHTKLRAA